MKRKNLLHLLLIVILTGSILFLSGCSRSGTSTSETQTEDDAAASNLPPDPGEEGKKTLAGIDSDDDGVRDDVQRYIALTYPDSEKTRAGLTQYAKSVQGALLDADDKELSMKHEEKISKADDCIEFMLGTDEYDQYISNEALPMILNTKERTMAYFKYDEQLGGEVFSLTPEDQLRFSCDIDPSTLSN